MGSLSCDCRSQLLTAVKLLAEQAGVSFFTFRKKVAELVLLTKSGHTVCRCRIP
ncbi:hypothetical protein [Anaplasma phagocytophilum]|uniref:hypothetical protein n=1 Tax=Anaplasma phagocytophilum TaxID=948 RepID=UPI000AF1865B|nr:hypothetical protein [Anaplasma phagocytophilum]